MYVNKHKKRIYKDEENCARTAEMDRIVFMYLRGHYTDLLVGKRRKKNCRRGWSGAPGWERTDALPALTVPPSLCPDL